MRDRIAGMDQCRERFRTPHRNILLALSPFAGLSNECDGRNVLVYTSPERPAKGLWNLLSINLAEMRGMCWRVANTQARERWHRTSSYEGARIAIPDVSAAASKEAQERCV